MKRYLCITVTVLALVVTGVVLFVHYHSTEDSKRKRSVTSHPIPRSPSFSQKLAYLALKLKYSTDPLTSHTCLSYESALVGFSYATTTFPVSASTANSTSSYIYIYQASDTSIRLTYAFSDYKIFTVTDFAREDAMLNTRISIQLSSHVLRPGKLSKTSRQSTKRSRARS